MAILSRSGVRVSGTTGVASEIIERDDDIVCVSREDAGPLLDELRTYDAAGRPKTLGGTRLAGAVPTVLWERWLLEWRKRDGPRDHGIRWLDYVEKMLNDPEFSGLRCWRKVQPGR